MERFPPRKLTEYDAFPLSSQIGFIHAIPEDDFDVAQATIMDVGFLGLFPKQVFQKMQAYARELEKNNEPNEEFIQLMNLVVSTFTYRALTVQKIIQTLLAGFKKYLDELDERRGRTCLNDKEEDALPTGHAGSATSKNSQMPTP